MESNKEDNQNNFVKKSKTFKERYQDPEFKKQHLKRMLTKVTCSCGKVISRCYMSTHKKKKVHQKALLQKEQERQKIDQKYDMILKHCKGLLDCVINAHDIENSD